MEQPQGINLDPSVLITVQNERLASAAIREAQLTAAVQQLTMENMQLREQLPKEEDAVMAIVEEQDANTDS